MKKTTKGIAAVAFATAALVALPVSAARASDGQYVSWPGGGETIVWPPDIDSLLLSIAAQDAPNGFCFTAQLSGIGWDGRVSCVNSGGGPEGGTSAGFGQSGDRIEAVAFAPGPNVSEVCLQAHVQNIGWQTGNCASTGFDSAVGTTGMALDIEDLRIWAAGRDFTAQAGLTNGQTLKSTTCISPNPLGPNTLAIGTTGQDLVLLRPGC